MRFFELFDLFRFVTSWDDPSIAPNTIRLFAKKVPVFLLMQSIVFIPILSGAAPPRKHYNAHYLLNSINTVMLKGCYRLSLS